MEENTPSDTRNRADFLMGHATFLRGGSKRNCQFPDFFTMEIPDEGPQKCTAVVIIQDQGKTNQFGKILYSAFFRNKNALTCPVGALGFLLLSRFHLSNEQFPDFTRNENWYDFYLLLGDGTNKRKRRKVDSNGHVVLNEETGKPYWETYEVDPRKTPISYQTQYNAYKRALEACGIHISKVTHANRKSAPAMATMDGAPEASTRRMGHWSHGTMESCYLSAELPLGTMRPVAGFNTGGGTYFLHRATLEAPESLKSKIFPEADRWMAMYENSEIERDIAGGNFLQLLIFLRDVILQDSVVLMPLFPDSHLWKCAIFSTPEYLDFADRLRSSITESEANDPVDRQLKNVMPRFHDMVSTNLTGRHNFFDITSYSIFSTDCV